MLLYMIESVVDDHDENDYYNYLLVNEKRRCRDSIGRASPPPEAHVIKYARGGAIHHREVYR